MSRPRALALSAAVTALLTAALATLLVVTGGWAERARPATCLPDGCFCEALHDRPFLQPANTLSSLVYLALGVWALARLVGRPGAPAGSGRVLMPAAALVTCGIGLASAFYHATLTFLGQYLDVMSMYVLGALLVAGALWRGRILGERSAMALFVALCLVLGVAQYVEPELRRVMFAAVLLPGIVLEHTRRVHGPTRPHDLIPLRVGVVLLVVAYGFWLLDQWRVLCWPDSWFQGHAAWHTLTAFAAVLLVSHYARTPKPTHLTGASGFGVGG